MEENNVVMEQDPQVIVGEETYVPPVPMTEEVVELAPTASEEPVVEEQTVPEAQIVAPQASKLKVGDRVRLLIDPPGGSIVEATVRVVQDVPGKLVGVELDNFMERCHSLEGIVAEMVDETRGMTLGKGWWTREEYVELM